MDSVTFSNIDTDFGMYLGLYAPKLLLISAI